MPAIYQPKGKALEYSPLALNLYKGCSHACTYCYAPAATFTDRALFSNPAYVTPRPGILDQLERDARRYRGDSREILLSFTSDAYQPAEAEHLITRRALETLKKYHLRPTILTKAGPLAQRDLDILRTIPGAAFAVTLTTQDARESLHWEPGAALPDDRIKNLQAAKEAGMRAWISFEPVYNPAAIPDLIHATKHFTDFYKVGKMNHHPAEKEIDWRAFLEETVALLDSLGKPFYIKRDLAAYGRGK
jgi:DNA repair photolyase